MRDNRFDPSPYAVYCHGDCGLVFLTDEQYDYQMNRPDSFWFCPHCGDSADWDDDCQVTNPQDEDDDGTAF